MPSVAASSFNPSSKGCTQMLAWHLGSGEQPLQPTPALGKRQCLLVLVLTGPGIAGMAECIPKRRR